jgi:hypothetical protein
MTTKTCHTLEDQLERIESFAALARGWMGKPAEGEPGDRCAVDAARRFLAGIFSADSRLPLPAVFPMPDGGVQIEWRTCEIRFPPGGKVLDGCGPRETDDFEFLADAVTPAEVAAMVRSFVDASEQSA